MSVIDYDDDKFSPMFQRPLMYWITPATLYAFRVSVLRLTFLRACASGGCAQGKADTRPGLSPGPAANRGG